MRRFAERASFTLLAALYLVVVLGGRVGDLRSVPSTGGPVHAVTSGSPAPAAPRAPYVTVRRHLPLTQRVEMPAAVSVDAPAPGPVRPVLHRTASAPPRQLSTAALPPLPSRAPPLF